MVNADDHKRFAAAFDELVGLGCLPETLASTLYCFCKSYAPRKWSYPTYRLGISFPRDNEIKKLRNSLQSAYEGIPRVDDYEVMEDLARHADCGKPPRGRRQVLEVLRWYYDSLSLWKMPRKDIVQGSAPIACCIYPKIVTGEFRFPLVAELLECLGYSPDPKRQTKSRDRPDKTNPCFQSLERNCTNFRKAHPIFCYRLQGDLRSDHECEKFRRKEDSYYRPLKRLPISAFDQLRLNRFDWRIVFQHPEPKQKRGGTKSPTLLPTKSRP